MGRAHQPSFEYPLNYRAPAANGARIQKQGIPLAGIERERKEGAKNARAAADDPNFSRRPVCLCVIQF